MYDREGVVVVMQEFLPFEILRRLSETDSVIFQSFPSNQQDVPICVFDANFKLMSDIAGHARNNILSPREVAQKILTLARLHVQSCYFKYQQSTPQLAQSQSCILAFKHFAYDSSIGRLLFQSLRVPLTASCVEKITAVNMDAASEAKQRIGD